MRMPYTLFCVLVLAICLFQCINVTASTNDTTKTDYQSLLTKSKAYRQKSKLDSSIFVLQTILSKAKAENATTYISNAYLNLALIHTSLRDYSIADSLHDLSITHFDGKDSIGLARNFIGKSTIQANLGRYEEMPALLAKARQAIHQDTTSREMLVYLLNSAVYSNHQSEFYTSIDYYNKAIQLLTPAYEQYRPVININLAYVYGEIKAYDYAIELNKAIYDSNSASYQRMFALYGLMYAHYRKEEYTQLKQYIEAAIQLRKETGQSINFGNVYYFQGQLHRKQQQLDSAAYYYQKGLVFSETKNEDLMSSYNHLGLALVAHAQKDWPTLLTHSQHFNTLSTKPNTELNATLADMYHQTGNSAKAFILLKENETIYQSQETAAKNTFLTKLLSTKVQLEERKKQYLHEQALQVQQYQLRISWLLASLIFLASVVFIWMYLQSRKRNQLLEEDLKNKQLIEQQAKELKQMDALKSRLFTNISHELRTPLTLITSPIKNLLNSKRLNEQEEQMLQMAVKNSAQLLQYADQILELTKAEVQGLELELATFSVADFLIYMEQKFKDICIFKSIDLQVIDKTTTPNQVLLDPKKLETIISNLVNNAIKHTLPKDQIKIQVVDLGENIQLDIQDTGKGIDPTDLPHIFDRYYQSKTGQLQPDGGFGIGLSICKEYVDFLKGKIIVKSEVGKGSIFSVILPKQIDPPIDVTLVEAYSFLPIINSPKKVVLSKEKINRKGYILLVEDNMDMCTYLEKLLTPQYDIKTSHNGVDAIKTLEQHLPILIITDLMMPVMGGLEFINQLKSNDAFSKIPILVLTAKVDVLTELKTFRIGINEYLMKPFDENELMTSIYKLLHVPEQLANDKERQLLESQIITSEDITTLNSADLDWLRRLEEVVTNEITDPNLNVGRLAEILSISSTNLNNKMKIITGLTPKRYINEVRLLMGKRLLSQKDKEISTIKELAYQLGFKSDQAFSRQFKARFGKRPSEY